MQSKFDSPKDYEESKEMFRVEELTYNQPTSHKRFKRFTKLTVAHDRRIPLIRKIAKMSRSDVYRRLTRIKSCEFYRRDAEQLKKELRFSDAV